MKLTQQFFNKQSKSQEKTKMTKARDIADFKLENIVDTGTEGTKQLQVLQHSEALQQVNGDTILLLDFLREETHQIFQHQNQHQQFQVLMMAKQIVQVVEIKLLLLQVLILLLVQQLLLQEMQVQTLTHQLQQQIVLHKLQQQHLNHLF